MSAPARRESRRVSPLTCEPSPTGTPVATISTTPPSVSPSFFAVSISAIIDSSAALSNARTGLSSIAARSEIVGGGPTYGVLPPIEITCEITSIPNT